MQFAFALLSIAMFTVSATATQTPNDTAALFFWLVNPTTELGFADDATGVSLPDTEAIADKLSDTQQDEIIRQTIAQVDRAFGGVAMPMVHSPKSRKETTRKGSPAKK